MNNVRSALGVLTLLSLPAIGLSPRLAADEADAVALYKKVVKSCVFIVTPMKGGYGMGSGSLIDLDKKLVVTNYHVVQDENVVFVQFPIYLKDSSLMTEKDKYIENITLGKAIKGTVLCRDKSRDLALVTLDKVPSGTPAITLAKQSPETAETTWNIGSPGAVKQVFGVTKGEVRAVGLEKFLVGGHGPESVFEVKAKFVTATNPTNPGDSGGPLFDKRGYQVAVTESGSTSASLVNHFVDVSEVWALLAEKKIQIKDSTGTATAFNDKKTDPIKPKDPGTAPKDPGVSPKDPPPAVTPAGPSAEDEKAAALLLSRAKVFASGEDNRPDYIRKLNEVIKKYPGTVAARDSKKLLDGLK